MQRMTLRLPDHLHARVRALAYESGRSLNEQIVMIVEEGTAGVEGAVAPLDGQLSVDDVRADGDPGKQVKPDPKVKA